MTEKETKLIGCMTYGYPVGRSAVKSMIPTLEKEQVLELTRLYIDDGYGKNIESLSMGKSFKWLKQNRYKNVNQLRPGTNAFRNDLSGNKLVVSRLS